MRPFALTIAGHDPSGGAGITTDCKTFEQLNVQGLSVCTALTVQTDIEFHSPNWIDEQLILEQLKLVMQRFQPATAKIGLIESSTMLLKVIETIKRHQPETVIIWDPILNSSTGFSFHSNIDQLNKVLKTIDLLTPNCDEAKILFGSEKQSTLKSICQEHRQLSILLKGGHCILNKGDDFLLNQNNTFKIEGKKQHLLTDKHGTGCVLSAAVTAELAHKRSMPEACETAKRYVENLMLSNKSLLGYHNHSKS